jgi:uncharacterized protein YoxC
MPALIQICVVIVTIGLLAIALLALRMVTRAINKAADDISQLTLAVRESVAQFDVVTHEAQALVASLRDCVPPVQRVLDRFEDVGQRTADLSSAVLEELELPVFTAAAVARGVRSGADHLLRRLIHRFAHRHTPIYGGNDHE